MPRAESCGFEYPTQGERVVLGVTELFAFALHITSKMHMTCPVTHASNMMGINKDFNTGFTMFSMFIFINANTIGILTLHHA